MLWRKVGRKKFPLFLLTLELQKPNTGMFRSNESLDFEGLWFFNQPMCTNMHYIRDFFWGGEYLFAQTAHKNVWEKMNINILMNFHEDKMLEKCGRTASKIGKMRWNGQRHPFQGRFKAALTTQHFKWHCISPVAQPWQSSMSLNGQRLWCLECSPSQSESTMIGGATASTQDRLGQQFSWSL